MRRFDWWVYCRDVLIALRRPGTLAALLWPGKQKRGYGRNHNPLIILVEQIGIEPTASSVRGMRSPS
jgi:hypothetical protein